MLVIQISRHCSEQILARGWEFREKRAKLRKGSEGFFLFYLRWSQVMTEEMSFQVSLENGQGFSNLDEGGKFIAVVQSRNHKSLDKKLCCVRKGLIFLMLCSANLQDRAVFAMWSLKASWSSKITPIFLTKLDGVIVEEPSWMVKSCCRVGVAGKTRSPVFARLSCRWCSFIHAEMSARQPEIRAATVGSSGRNTR